MDVLQIFNFINSFEKEKKINLLETTTNKEFEVLLKKNNTGLSFRLPHPFFNLLYKKDAVFKLSSELITLDIVNFLVKNEQHSLMSRVCEAYMFQTLNFNSKEEKYYSYYSKINSFFLLNFFEEYQQDLSVYIRGLKFKISTCIINNKKKVDLLCIQCENKLDFKKFKHYVNNIIVSIGFFSGEFYKKEEFFFQSTVKDFSINTDLFYRSSNLEFSFPEPFTYSPNSWSWKFKNEYELDSFQKKEFSSRISKKSFLELVELLIRYPRIYFSIRMVFSFYNFSVLSRVSMLFVVLEVICEEFKNDLDTNYIQKELKYKLGQKLLEKYKESIAAEDFIILDDIIENIDKRLTNNIVNYEQVFDALNINLSNEDRFVLKKRNHFFHGRIIPKSIQIDSEEAYVNLEKNYFHDSLRLYVLVSKLILKKVKFSGYIINYPKLFEEENILRESYFVKLN
ncbi:hypothetical protein ACFSSB_13355 [Lacinutrix gracilariae]|uniref:ApeA N-terminal domain-containing protein n=1 Tax=Lacinutrix gracilariae TaxID=1747198 RepID=A0ABW5K2Z5_9FLAO